MTDRLTGKAPPNSRRSSRWPNVRDAFLKGRRCAVCHGRKYLTAHHIVPFHLAPDLELIEDNLLPLCEAGRYGINCHLLVGHFGNWQRTNTQPKAYALFLNELLVGSR